MKETYKGTTNLNIKVAVNRLIELLDKAPLGGNDEEFYKECKDYIETNLDELLRDAGNFKYMSKNKLISSTMWDKIYYRK